MPGISITFFQTVHLTSSTAATSASRRSNCVTASGTATTEPMKGTAMVSRNGDGVGQQSLDK